MQNERHAPLPMCSLLEKQGQEKNYLRKAFITAAADHLDHLLPRIARHCLIISLKVCSLVHKKGLLQAQLISPAYLNRRREVHCCLMRSTH